MLCPSRGAVLGALSLYPFHAHEPEGIPFTRTGDCRHRPPERLMSPVQDKRPPSSSPFNRLVLKELIFCFMIRSQPSKQTLSSTA